MCDGQGSPSGVAEALAMLGRALDHLNAADVASLPASVQAEALRALGRAEAKHTAAQARVLGAFAAQGGFEDDGHGTARTWLKWQTRITTGAAAGAIGWARRLAAHPVIERALADGELSPSWARNLCAWTGRLPEAQRGDADEILAGAARGGADLAALGGLAQEIYERSCRDGGGPEDDFEDRWFRLGITFRGAGHAEGDLSPGCAAALAAVLEALGKKAGPEDTRTRPQRCHDALEEACRLADPGRAGPGPGRAADSGAGAPELGPVARCPGRFGGRGCLGGRAGVPARLADRPRSRGRAVRCHGDPGRDRARGLGRPEPASGGDSAEPRDRPPPQPRRHRPIRRPWPRTRRQHRPRSARHARPSRRFRPDPAALAPASPAALSSDHERGDPDPGRPAWPGHHADPGGAGQSGSPGPGQSGGQPGHQAGGRPLLPPDRRR